MFKLFIIDQKTDGTNYLIDAQIDSAVIQKCIINIAKKTKA